MGYLFTSQAYFYFSALHYCLKIGSYFSASTDSYRLKTNYMFFAYYDENKYNFFNFFLHYFFYML